MNELLATIDSIHSTFDDVMVFHAYTENGKRVRMVGNKDNLFHPGEHRHFKGCWENYKSIGKQFRVEQSCIASVTDAMVKSFLINQTGIGKATATKLITKFGDRLPVLLDESNTDELIKAPNVGEAVAYQAVNAWHQQGAKAELINYISSPLAIQPEFINKLTKAVLKAHEFYQHTTLENLKEDPYRLWAFCSWKDTDRLALALGIKKDDRRRLLCAFEESLYQLYRNGHTAATPDMVNEILTDLLDGEHHCLAIYEASRNDNLAQRRFVVRDNGNWSLPASAIMENYVFNELVSRIGIKSSTQLSMFHDSDMSGYLLPNNMPLDQSQEEAVNTILKHDICAVIGAAGTGKTSVLYAANELVHRTGRQVLQVALSGKAAQRLIQQTKQDAYTIESLLSKIQATPRFLDKYDMPVLFIDEASMVDLPLMFRVLKAFENRPLKVVFIGDRGQLPPIGPGLVFHKLIESDRFPIVELTTNYRALAGSTIPAISHAIREGKHFTPSKDVTLIECSEYNVAKNAVEQYLQHKQHQTVQIISATLRVMATSNRRLQSLLVSNSPTVESAPEFRIGDKVIYKKNDKHLGLVNGSMGTIVEPQGDVVVVNEEQGTSIPADMVIEFDNEGRIPLLLSQIKTNMMVSGMYNMLMLSPVTKAKVQSLIALLSRLRKHNF